MGKTIIVTGGARGIGGGIVKHFLQLNWNVVAADMNTPSYSLTENGNFLFVKTDVRKVDEIINLMAVTVEKFGSINALINNAGKMMYKSPYELSEEDWMDVLQTNLSSVFFCSREAAKRMKETGGGAIVNIASTRALMSEPFTESYSASKGGIVALTHSLAASFSEDRITVNTISPGWIESGNYAELREVDHLQHFSKRVGTPSDIARACEYLVDERNNFVNGINLVVDGGMTRKMIYEP